MGDTTSADPDRLDTYRHGAEALADDVLRRTGAADDALHRLVASGSVGVPASAGLVHQVRSNAVAGRRLADWIGTVAGAFRSADRGTIPPPPARRAAATIELVAAFEQVRDALASGDLRRLGRVLTDLRVSGYLSGAERFALMGSQLTAAQLRRLATLEPEVVGPNDGWPPEARFIANRILIRQALLLATGDRRVALQRFLEPDPATGRPRQFLLFDPAGDGRVVEVFGSLRTADDVAVYVPGMSSYLDSFDARIASKARALWQASTALAGGHEVAVIAWLGYDAPGDLPFLQVAGRSFAQDGARDLVDFTRGLDLRSDQRFTVVAHSYGTVVAGEALHRGLDADAVLVMGSPGMPGALGGKGGTRQETELFTMEAPGDLVTDLERFGDDPNEDDSPYTRLETGGHGHSSYLAPGTASLTNAGHVVTGTAGLDTRDRTLVEDYSHVLNEVPTPISVTEALIDGLQRHLTVPVVDGATDRIVDTAQGVVDSVDVPGVVERATDAIDRISDGLRFVFG